MSESLERRIDRIEAHMAIEQLAIRYAIAVDSRDIDAWLGLFIPDVHCGRNGNGRDVLRSIIVPALRSFYRSVHQICGHRIEFDDPDNARGVVYCRAEHEAEGKWILMAIAYFDSYERREGEWYFVRRQEKHWYSADWERRPTAPFIDWGAHSAAPELPQHFGSWNAFWTDQDVSSIAALTAQPAGAGE